MFVYDAGNKLSFDTLHTLIETIKELEKSEQKGKRQLSYSTKKIVIGNKKDMKDKKQVLEKTDLKKLEGMRFREVSSLTNQGIQEAFKILISDINNDSQLGRDLFEKEKRFQKDNEDLME